tara:strand:+ start:186 stop:374 length:189 start_codon:yes stop_codon:yes gene_type:complete
MAHLHLIEDSQGELVDYSVFCSDYCNREHSGNDYAGWHGCNEISTTQPCENCGETVQGLDEE